MVAMLLFGAASCQDKNSGIDPDTLETGTTYMSLVLDLSQSIDELRLTRAEDDDVHNPAGEWEGRDLIKNVDVYILHPSRGTIQVQTVTEITPPAPGQDGIYATPAWAVQPGTGRSIYVVVNNDGLIKTQLNAAATGSAPDKIAAFEAAYKAAYEYTLDTYAKEEGAPLKDVILMSGQPLRGVQMKAGVTAEQATINSGTPISLDKNQFALTVRRSAARVAVTKDPAITTEAPISDGVNTYGTLKNLKWTYGQFEKKTYLLWNDSATVISGDTKLHYTTKSPNWGYVPTVADYTTQAQAKYDYSLVNDLSKLKAINALTGNTPSVTNIITDGNMQFINETTHQYGPESQQTIGQKLTGYRKGNTAYVMIEAVFTPVPEVWATGEQGSYIEGNDLFYNMTNGKFYASETNAKNAVIGTYTPPKDGLIKYPGGKVYYFAWLNPDGVDPATGFKPDKVFNSPVIRNNIYHINVTGFKKLGFSGNPYNPYPGPTNPIPVDPDEDVPTPDELLKTVETYMAAQITVVNWGVHTYNVQF